MQCFLPTVEIKDYNVMIYGRNFLYQRVKNDLRTQYNIREIEIDQSDAYATGFLIDYPYCKIYSELITIRTNNQ